MGEIRVSPFGVTHSLPTLVARAVYEAPELPELELFQEAVRQFSDGNSDEEPYGHEDLMSAIEAVLPIRFVEHRPNFNAAASVLAEVESGEWPWAPCATFMFAEGYGCFQVRYGSETEFRDGVREFALAGCPLVSTGPGLVVVDEVLLRWGFRGDPANMADTTGKR